MGNNASYQRFCKRYGLDPASDEARKQYRESRAALAALESAAAKAEAQEAIDKARRG